jgi:hypothetical protein
MVSADRAEQRINAARAKAIADAKKGAISADRAEQRINSAVAKATAEVRAANARPVVSTPTTTTTTTTNNDAAREQAARDQAAREQAARDQAAAAAAQAAAQAAAEQAAREAAAREAARREQERLEALKRAEEARIAAIVAARPTVPKYAATRTVDPVKYASPADVLIQESTLPVDLILKQTLEKIGGLELISLVRHDTVNGQEIAYQPVKNLSEIQRMYNPQNIVKIPDSSELYFKNFAIKIETHIPPPDPPPDDENTVSIDMFSKENHVYIDPTSGKIIIELLNLKPDYEIEIQTVSLGKVFGGTIYDEDEL